MKQARKNRQEPEACLRVVFPYLHGRRLVIEGSAQSMRVTESQQAHLHVESRHQHGGTHLFLLPSTFSTEYAGFSSFLTSSLSAQQVSAPYVQQKHPQADRRAFILLKCSHGK